MAMFNKKESIEIENENDEHNKLAIVCLKEEGCNFTVSFLSKRIPLCLCIVSSYRIGFLQYETTCLQIIRTIPNPYPIVEDFAT